MIFRKKPEIVDSDDERPASIVHDESIVASNGSSISSVKNFVRSNKEMLLGISLAMNIIMGAAVYFELRTAAVADDLRRDDFTQFKNKDWADLKIQVGVTEGLIAAKCGK